MIKFYPIYTMESSLNFKNFMKQIGERINGDQEILDSTRQANIKFYDVLKAQLENVEKVNIAFSIAHLMTHTPQYRYYKNIEFNNKKYDIEIDIINRTFCAIEI